MGVVLELGEHDRLGREQHVAEHHQHDCHQDAKCPPVRFARRTRRVQPLFVGVPRCHAVYAEGPYRPRYCSAGYFSAFLTILSRTIVSMSRPSTLARAKA